MKIYVLLLYFGLTVFTYSKVSAKSLTPNRFSGRDDFAAAENYPVKRKTPSFKELRYANLHEEQPDVEYLDTSGESEEETLRKLESNKRFDSKRSPSGWLNKRGRLSKRDLNSLNHDEPYGIVYSNGKPLGILEPYPQAYEFSPLVNDKEGIEEIQPVQTVSRESHQPLDILYRSGRFSIPYHIGNDYDRNDHEIDSLAKNTDDKYPALLADFKIENKQSANKRENSSRLPRKQEKKEESKNSVTKRETSPKKINRKMISDAKIAELKTALNKVENSNEGAEDNLIGVLDNMGLIENDKGGDEFNKAKRNIDKEDENLNEGVGKCSRVVSGTEFIKRNTFDDRKLNTKEEPSLSTANSQLKSKREFPKVANYQKEGEAFIRGKRQLATTTENSDIIKSLEKSGDLTFSGNKSPLASLENDAANEEKDKVSLTTPTLTEKVKREQNDEQYQKQLEHNIAAKIDAIKEQVKREIEELKRRDTLPQKRNSGETLLEEETNALDPRLHPGDKLTPLVRRRRNLEARNHKRRKRGLPDFSNLQNIDTGDYLDLTGEKPLRNERETRAEYQMDPQEEQFFPEALANDRDLYIHNKMFKRRGTLEDDQLNDLEDYDESEFLNERNRRRERDVNAQNPTNLEDSFEKERVESKEDDSLQKREQMIKELDNNKLLNKLHMLDELKREESKRNAVDGASTAEPTKDVVKKSTDSDAAPSKQKRDIQEKYEETLDNEQPKSGSSETTSTAVDQKRNADDDAPVQMKLDENPNLKSNQKRNSESLDSSKSDSDNTSEDTNAQALNKDIKKRSPDLGNENLQQGDQTSEDKRSLEKQDDNNSDPDEKRSPKAETSTVSTTCVTNKPSGDMNIAEEQSKRSADQGLQSNEQQLESSIEDTGEPVGSQHSRRKRRNYDEPVIIRSRSKRANSLFPDVAYVPYPLGNEEAEEEENEFEDGGFNDRSVNLQKRETSNDYDAPPFHKRSIDNLYEDDFEEEYVRRKRQDFDDMAAVHGGGAMLHHLAAVRERNAQQANDRTKRTFEKHKRDAGSDEEPQKITDLSDTDLFGALPQNYEGELSRFKRIRRSNNEQLN